MGVTKKLDGDMLIEDLYVLRSLIPAENKEAREKLREIIELVLSAPNDERGQRFPRISVGRG